MIGSVPTPFLLVMIVLYFVPTAVALLRGHRNSLAIFLLNLFLGATGFGWVIALLWAVYREPSDSRR